MVMDGSSSDIKPSTRHQTKQDHTSCIQYLPLLPQDTDDKAQVLHRLVCRMNLAIILGFTVIKYKHTQ